MTNGIGAAAKAAAAMFVHFSEILNMDVVSTDGKIMGKVWDMSVKAGEVYPKIEEVIIRKGLFKRSYAVLPWSSVLVIQDDVILSIKSDAVRFSSGVKDYEFLIKRDILDQQVVDTFNHKVRRVNDIHLLKVDHDYVMAHVDIGLRGLVRRLGWDRWVDAFIRIVKKNSKYLKTEELVSWKYVQPVAINPASMTMKLSVSGRDLASIPAADMGDIIFDLTPGQRMALFRTLEPRTKSRVFENLEFDEQKAILRELDKKEASQIVSDMSSDDAADFLEKLPRNSVENLLTLMESSRAKKLWTLLRSASDSAGGLMTTEFVALPETMTVAAAIDYVRTQTKEFEVVPYIYVVDDKNHLKGATTIRKLLFADPKELISKTVFPKNIHVYLNNSVSEVAYFVDKYKVSAIPVIDENKILHGIITVDDILSQVVSIAWRRRQRRSKGI